MMIYVWCLLVVFLPVSIDCLSDDISIVRQRVLEQMVWPNQDLVPSIAKNGRYFANTLNSSCYWQDIKYDDQNRAIWLTAQHLTRITTMLQAYTVNGSQEQNDTKILRAAQCALDVWLTRDWQNPNWWWNRISVPISVTGHLLMLGPNVTDFQLNKIKEVSYRANWWAGDMWTTGANLVWMIQAQLYRSLATQNVTGIEQGFSRMWKDIVIQPIGVEGIQSDFAYHFHETQLLSAAYGAVWADNILSFFSCSQGTIYAPTNDQLLIFARFLTEGDAWMIIGNQWDFHAIGRAISRPDDGYIVDFNTKIIRSIAEAVSLADLRTNLTNLADRLDRQTNATLLIGNKHFYTSDYQAHRRINWTAAIKIKSIRAIPDECGNGENLKGEHTGSGTLHLFSTDTSDYYQIFPLLDWQAINGITVEHDIPIVPCPVGLYRLDRLPFAGGVSDGFYGLAAMDTISHNLTAQRSWHFYDDAIFALATNLTLTTPNIAWTTLASRLLNQGQIMVGFFNSTIITLNDGNYSFAYDQNKSSNVQWIHVDQSNIAYLLQTQQQYDSIGIRFGIESGNYDTIGASNLNKTARTLTIWIDHGRGPYTLDYQYIILPNISLESVPKVIQQYEEEQIFECISTNQLFHGLVWPSLKRASFVLWQNISTTFSCKSSSFELNIELNDAGIYLFSETDSDFTLTASHPMRVNNTLNLTIDRIGYGQGCATTNNITNITLTLPTSFQFMGQSVNTKCKKLSFN